MCPLVYLEILASGEHLPTTGKRTWERFLPRVHPNMVHQFILGLEGPPIPRAILPKARVRRTLRAPHVLHSQMCYYLVHTGEMFTARFPLRLFRIHPQALHLLLDRLTHITKKSTMYGGRRIARMMMWYAHMMGMI